MANRKYDKFETAIIRELLALIDKQITVIELLKKVTKLEILKDERKSLEGITHYYNIEGISVLKEYLAQYDDTKLEVYGMINKFKQLIKQLTNEGYISLASKYDIIDKPDIDRISLQIYNDQSWESISDFLEKIITVSKTIRELTGIKVKLSKTIEAALNYTSIVTTIVLSIFVTYDIYVSFRYGNEREMVVQIKNVDNDTLKVRTQQYTEKNVIPIESSTIYFEFDSTAITKEARQVLSEITQKMNHYPQLGLVIVGHSDEIGNKQYNKKLAEQRAQAVHRYLQDHDIKPNRLKLYSEGEEYPAYLGQSIKGVSANRRVKFKFFLMQ